VSEEKSPNSRVTPFGREFRFTTVAKPQKAEPRQYRRDEHFWGEHNAEVGFFLLTLCNKKSQKPYPNHLTTEDLKTVLFVFVLLPFLLGLLIGCGGEDDNRSKIEILFSDKYSPDDFKQALEIRFDTEKDTSLICYKSFKYFNELKDFYSKRNFSPLWISENLKNSDIDSVLNYFRNSVFHGLDSCYYYSAYISNYLDSVRIHFEKDSVIDYQYLANAELMISNGLLEYVQDMKYGRIDPVKVFPTHHTMKMKDRDSTDLFNVLESKFVYVFLKGLEPKYQRYTDLQKSLRHYFDLREKGGWDSLFITAEKIEFGDTASFIDNLARRLMVTGDLDKSFYKDTVLSRYDDSTLFKAVVRYQKINGLLDDGVIGKNTINDLNVSVHDRIKQISANLERCRWFEYPDTGRYIMVNLPDFMFYLKEDGKTVLSMKICCGQQRESNFDKKMQNYLRTKKKSHKPNNHETPTMHSKISHFILNPDWQVPANITDNEIIYKVLKDSFYLEENGYKIYKGDSLIDPLTINWKYYADKRLPYKIKQDPGDGNSLGRIKFMFNNKFSIYLHDTPNKAAFQRAYRAVSHGCMRIQKPMELAEYLIKDHKHLEFDDIRMDLGLRPIDDEDKQKFKKRLEKFKEKEKEMKEPGFKFKSKTIYLEKSIPLYVDYFTAWVDSTGTLQFRQDIYERDKVMIKKMW